MLGSEGCRCRCRPMTNDAVEPPCRWSARSIAMSRRCLPWPLLGAWLAVLVFVASAGSEEFSFSRCMVTGSGSDVKRPRAPERPNMTSSRELACARAQQEYEARRQAQEAAQRLRQRQAEEEATRRQMEAAAKDAADQAAKERRSKA